LRNGAAVVVSRNKGTLEELTSTKRVTLASGFDHPAGVVVTSLDEIYVSEPSTGTIYQVHKDGEKTVLTTGLYGITALTSDGYGGIIGVQTKFGNLLTISRQGVSKLWVGGLDHPTDVVKDAFGYVNVTLRGTGHKNGSVVRIIEGQTPVVIQSGLNDPTGITADALGNIFYVESGAHRIWEFMNALGSQIVSQASDKVGMPIVVVSDFKGDIYVLEHKPNALVHYILKANSTTM
jgi:hypothetical protein